MMHFRLQLGILVLVVLKLVNAAHALEPGVTPESGSLSAAIQLLEQTPTGKAALEQARLHQIPIHAGAISKTEITVTRSVDAASTTQDEKLKFVTQVVIARDKEPVFQALDLAHELVHAVNPKKNPFDPNLNAQDYIQYGIEGNGGEAQAIAQECKVGKELTSLKQETSNLIKARCEFVWNTENDTKKWQHSFYQLGQYYHAFLGLMRNYKTESNAAWTDRVEAKSPVFSSAVAHKPYPLALLEEYVQITRVICEKALKTNMGRKIASVASLETRCRAVSANTAE